MHVFQYDAASRDNLKKMFPIHEQSHVTCKIENSNRNDPGRVAFRNPNEVQSSLKSDRKFQ